MELIYKVKNILFLLLCMLGVQQIRVSGEILLALELVQLTLWLSISPWPRYQMGNFDLPQNGSLALKFLLLVVFSYCLEQIPLFCDIKLFSKIVYFLPLQSCDETEVVTVFSVVTYI